MDRIVPVPSYPSEVVTIASIRTVPVSSYPNEVVKMVFIEQFQLRPTKVKC